MNDISWVWKRNGDTEGFCITLDNVQIHFCNTIYERDMFIAEIKAKINILKDGFNEFK